MFDVPARWRDAGPSNPDITIALTSDPNVTAKGRVRERAPRADAATGTFDPKTGTVALRPVEFGSHQSDRVAIVAGLDAGDMVVTAGVHALHPGQKVRPLGPAR